MRVTRRRFAQSSALLLAGAAAPAAIEAQGGNVPASVRALKPFPGRAVPISENERRARIEKARKLMTDNGLGAIVLEPGTSMAYFVDVRWGLSERPFLVVIPAKGDLA